MNTFIQLRTGLIIKYGMLRSPVNMLNSDNTIHNDKVDISLDGGFTWHFVRLSYRKADVIAEWSDIENI